MNRTLSKMIAPLALALTVFIGTEASAQFRPHPFMPYVMPVQPVFHPAYTMVHPQPMFTPVPPQMASNVRPTVTAPKPPTKIALPTTPMATPTPPAVKVPTKASLPATNIATPTPPAVKVPTKASLPATNIATPTPPAVKVPTKASLPATNIATTPPPPVMVPTNVAAPARVRVPAPAVASGTSSSTSSKRQRVSATSGGTLSPLVLALMDSMIGGVTDTALANQAGLAANNAFANSAAGISNEFGNPFE